MTDDKCPKCLGDPKALIHTLDVCKGEEEEEHPLAGRFNMEKEEQDLVGMFCPECGNKEQVTLADANRGGVICLHCDDEVRMLEPEENLIGNAPVENEVTFAYGAHPETGMVVIQIKAKGEQTFNVNMSYNPEEAMDLAMGLAKAADTAMRVKKPGLVLPPRRSLGKVVKMPEPGSVLAKAKQRRR